MKLPSGLILSFFAYYFNLYAKMPVSKVPGIFKDRLSRTDAGKYIPILLHVA